MKTADVERVVERTGWIFRVFQSVAALAFFIPMAVPGWSGLYHDAASYWYVPTLVAAAWLAHAGHGAVCRRKDPVWSVVVACVHGLVTYVLISTTAMAALVFGALAVAPDPKTPAFLVPAVCWACAALCSAVIVGVLWSWLLTLNAASACWHLRERNEFEATNAA
jgi:hypothetical protein